VVVVVVVVIIFLVVVVVVAAAVAVIEAVVEVRDQQQQLQVVAVVAAVKVIVAVVRDKEWFACWGSSNNLFPLLPPFFSSPSYLCHRVECCPNSGLCGIASYSHHTSGGSLANSINQSINHCCVQKLLYSYGTSACSASQGERKAYSTSQREPFQP